jgi:hypothetical protein
LGKNVSSNGRVKKTAYRGAACFVTFITLNLNYEVEEEEMGKTCRTNGEKRNTYMLTVEKPEGKRTLGRKRLGGWIMTT